MALEKVNLNLLIVLVDYALGLRYSSLAKISCFFLTLTMFVFRLVVLRHISDRLASPGNITEPIWSFRFIAICFIYLKIDFLNIFLIFLFFFFCFFSTCNSISRIRTFNYVTNSNTVFLAV